MARPKFGTLDPHGAPVAHDYGNRYFRQPCGDGERLVIGPTDKQVKLLDELATTFPTQRYYVLYILLLSHAGRFPSRYQSPLIECHEDLQLFIWTFQTFFESDVSTSKTKNFGFRRPTRTVTIPQTSILKMN